MNLGRCPTCHTRLDLVSMMEDASGRELLALVSRMSPKVSRALLTYLTLFRPPKRDLSLSRTLTLAQDVMALSRDTDTLTAAMLETVESIRNKPNNKPMKNHNYLKQVLAALVEQHGEHPVEPRSASTLSEKPQVDNDAAWRRQMEALGLELDDKGMVKGTENADQ